MTGTGVLDDIWMACTCPEGAMFEIWLKTDELEGIKNPPPKIDDICSFLAELMMIWMFLTGAGVLHDVLDGLHMP